MTTQTSGSDPLDSEIAARLERLAARKAAPALNRGGGSTVSMAYEPKDVSASGSNGVRNGRRHAAKRARIAALAASLLTTGSLTFGLFAADGQSNRVLVGAAGVVVVPSASPPVTALPPVSASPPVTAAAPTVVDGGAFRNPYGDVQVEATFSPDGALLDVSMLRFPNSNRESVQINQYATPRLNSEALSAQSAQVDTISGATYTSNDYERSLQSAIDLARADGITQLA